MFYDTPSIGIISSPDEVKPKPESFATPSNKIQVATINFIPRIVVQFQTEPAGFSFVQNKPVTFAMNHILVANGVGDLLPQQSFPVLMTNVGHRIVRLRKNQMVGHALPSPEGIFALGEGDGLQYSPFRDADVTGWKDEVNIGVECRDDRQKMI